MSISEVIAASPELTALADAENWVGVVVAWPEQRLPDERVSGRQTAVGLIAAGHDWVAITTAFDAAVLGRDLKTIMQSQDGINWADGLTVQSLSVLKNEVITQGVIDTLVGLSQRFAVVPTADEVQTEWLQHIAETTLTADETRHEVLLSCNRGTDGTTRVMARVTPVEFADGVLVRRLQPIVIANSAELIAALTPIIEGLTQ